MAKAARSYRLSEECLVELDELAEKWQCSQTAAIERAVHECGTCGTESGTTRERVDTAPDAGSLPWAVYEDMRKQLDRKDEQIAGLTDALRAAQALHGADTMPKRIEEPLEVKEGDSGATVQESPEKAPRRSLIARIFGK